MIAGGDLPADQFVNASIASACSIVQVIITAASGSLVICTRDGNGPPCMAISKTMLPGIPIVMPIDGRRPAQSPVQPMSTSAARA